ncbi:MAG TPA: LytTR family DNA-binding domain-containing protein [Thermoanaerobaculia bacterium]|jgi:two-component system LytT family response regulator|nr:LytTR family DNA-binding domain-containing protein [Thermoanaerobaculia bacterium]
MPDRTLRVVIVDDELLARQRIEDLLAKEPRVEIAGIARDGNEAVDVIRELKPDLVFLDVQMPGRTGVEVVETIGPDAMPATIFTTAYERFALKAFDVAAVDYLVKPFDDERFVQALGRARKAIEAQPAPKSEFLERISVESRGQIRVVPVAVIDYITASGPYAELHVSGRTFAIREKMQTLEEKLDPAIFFRIHRSAIVRLDRIETLLHAAGGDYAVRLTDGTELSVSRSRREELEARVGVT